MLGRHGARGTLLLLVLAGAVALAGCIGDEGGDVSPASANGTADGAAANDTATTTGLVTEARGTLAMTAGVGVPAGPWVYLGGGEVGVDVTENVNRLTVHANVTDEGVNATAPGAGFVGVELMQGDEVHET